jgi:hypothetical protein
MDLREIWYGGVEWMHMDQDTDQSQAFVEKVMNFRVP